MDYRSVNKVTLLGNLGKDADLMHTASRFAICTFSVATTERVFKKDADSVDRTEWHRCVLLGKRAESLHPFLKKGIKLYLEGKLQTREWKDKDGNRRFSTEVRVVQVVFAGGARPRSQGNGDYSGYEEFAKGVPANEAVAPKEGVPATADIPFPT